MGKAQAMQGHWGSGGSSDPMASLRGSNSSPGHAQRAVRVQPQPLRAAPGGSKVPSHPTSLSDARHPAVDGLLKCHTAWCLRHGFKPRFGCACPAPGLMPEPGLL